MVNINVLQWVQLIPRQILILTHPTLLFCRFCLRTYQELWLTTRLVAACISYETCTWWRLAFLLWLHYFIRHIRFLWSFYNIPKYWDWEIVILNNMVRTDRCQTTTTKCKLSAQLLGSNVLYISFSRFQLVFAQFATCPIYVLYQTSFREPASQCVTESCGPLPFPCNIQHSIAPTTRPFYQ